MIENHFPEPDLPLNVEGGLLPLHLHGPGGGRDDRLAASLDQLDQLGVLDHPVGGGVPRVGDGEHLPQLTTAHLRLGHHLHIKHEERGEKK